MTIFENIKAKNIDEFSKWLDEVGNINNTPWIKWFYSHYCSKCESVIGHVVDEHKDMEFAWCEVYGKCRFFLELDDTPDSRQMIKMWLESEYKNE